MHRLALIMLMAMVPGMLSAQSESGTSGSSLASNSDQRLFHRDRTNRDGDDPFWKRKTLLRWSKDGDEDEEMGEQRFVPDRPDFSENPNVVGLGRIQLEAGYTFLTDQQNGVRFSSHSLPESLLRIGVFAEWFEFRISGNTFFNTPKGLERFDVGEITDAEDFRLGCKFALTEQRGCLPETAVELSFAMPTGRSDSARQVLPGINSLVGWEIIKKQLELGGSFGVEQAVDPQGRNFVNLTGACVLEFEIAEPFSGYVEWFVLSSAGSRQTEAIPQHYANAGLMWLLKDNFQLDVKVGFGLNQRSADFFTGTGFCIRF